MSLAGEGAVQRNQVQDGGERDPERPGANAILRRERLPTNGAQGGGVGFAPHVAPHENDPWQPLIWPETGLGERRGLGVGGRAAFKSLQVCRELSPN